MSQEEDSQRLRADLDQARIEYLLTDADVALTFTTMANDHFSDEPKRTRLRENGKKAYSDIVHLAKGIPIDEPRLPELRNKLHKVRSELKELGVSVAD
jgi:hypothetical protein